MFRKGGEVMEGIMTGIKPRKMFSLGTRDQGIVSDVRRKMSLIDAVTGGGSGLSDPLTQFLLTAGPDLVEGKGAGGTKLQEIIGGVKPGLQAAMKTQQLKDLQDRKLATSLITKSKLGGAEQAWKDYGQYSGMSKEDFFREFGQKELFKKKTNPEELRIQKEKEVRGELGKFKDFLRNPKYSEVEKGLISGALSKIQGNKGLLASIDKQNPYYQGSDYTVGTPKKINNQDAKVLIPEDKDEFIGNKVYFMIEENGFFVFNEEQGQLIQLPGV
jgi:uncharacterized protein YfiM (DUF2279 family)